jgi:hypothetical protein
MSDFGSLIMLEFFVEFLEMSMHPPTLGDIKGLSISEFHRDPNQCTHTLQGGNLTNMIYACLWTSHIWQPFAMTIGSIRVPLLPSALLTHNT